jgi:hypothetical protein
MGSVIAPPGGSGSPGTGAEQALFMEARRRRRRRWLAGITAALAAAVVVAVSAVTWLPRAWDQMIGRSGAAGAALAGHSSTAAWQARITYRVVIGGVLEAYGIDDIRYSGRRWNWAYSHTLTAVGGEPAQTHSLIERYVAGRGYDYERVHGRMQWVTDPSPDPVIKIRDPRALLRAMESFTPFRAIGSEVIGGTRLAVLRATDPGRLTRRGLVPVAYTSGQPVVSLEVWVDRQQVVHRMAFTFRAPGFRIALTTPVSEAALQKVQQAKRALERIIREGQHAAQAGKRPDNRRLDVALRRFNLAGSRAYVLRKGPQVTTAAVTFSAIGQPQHITVPRSAISYCKVPPQTCHH